MKLERIKKKLSSKFFYALIFFGLTLLLRLIFFFATGLNPQSDYFDYDTIEKAKRSFIDGGGLINDPLDYQEIAVNIVNNNRYCRLDGRPTAFRAPGYPLFLALIFYFLGFSSQIAALINILLSALTVLPLFYLTVEIFSTRVASIACLLYSFNPISVFWSNSILAEPLFVFMLIASSLFYIISSNKYYRTITYFLFCIFFALASLIKPYMFLFFILIVFIDLRMLGIVLYLSILVIWPIRNYYTFGNFSSGSNSGFNFWIGSAGKIEYGLKFTSGAAYEYEEELLQDVENPYNEFSVQSTFYRKAFSKIKEKTV